MVGESLLEGRSHNNESSEVYRSGFMANKRQLALKGLPLRSYLGATLGVPGCERHNNQQKQIGDLVLPSA